MPALLEKRHFVCADLDKNSNKFWIIELYDNNQVITKYGRVGVTGESTAKDFSTAEKARSFFGGKIRDKLKVKKDRRDAYTEIQVLDSAVKTNHSTNVLDTALTEIETNDNQCKDLIKYLSAVNIHNIVSQTTIKYNVKDGCFTTPLGVVDKSCLDRAKTLLENISAKVLQMDGFKQDRAELLRLINQYVRYIPQDMGGSHVKIHAENIFGSEELLKKQADIIEGLEASVNMCGSETDVQGLTKRLFDVRMDLVDQTEQYGLVHKRLGSAGKLKHLYALTITSVFNRYDQYGKQLGNVQQFWHGTNPGNILSILRDGFVIRPNSVNGSRFGRGIYFSDNASMSLGYASAHERDRIRTRFMFVSDVSLGNVDYGSGSSLEAGFNSRWAEKESYTSQIIIYRTDQANILYLAEII